VRIDVLTLFPGCFTGRFPHSILGRAAEAGTSAVEVHDLRPYAEGKHRVTDEPPFGGGGGMVMKPEPIFAGSRRCARPTVRGGSSSFPPGIPPDAGDRRAPFEGGAPDPPLRPVRRGGPAGR